MLYKNKQQWENFVRIKWIESLLTYIFILYCFHIEKSLLYSFIYRFYTHYPNRFLLFYCFHKTLPKFFSFILLFPQMKVLWYFALFSFFKGKSFAFVHMMFTHHLAIFNICCTTNVSEVFYMGGQNAHWWVNNASRWMWAWWTLTKWLKWHSWYMLYEPSAYVCIALDLDIHKRATLSTIPYPTHHSPSWIGCFHQGCQNWNLMLSWIGCFHQDCQNWNFT